MKIPHAVRIGGVIFNVRWGDAKDPDWQKHRAVFGRRSGDIGRADVNNRLILLHPQLKKNRFQALSTLVHEILHIVDYGCRDNRYRWRAGNNHSYKWKLSHARIYQLEEPLAEFFMENVSLKCACEACNRPRKVRKLSGLPEKRLASG